MKYEDSTFQRQAKDHVKKSVTEKSGQEPKRLPFF